MLKQPVLIAIKENGQCWKYLGTEDGLGIPYKYRYEKTGLDVTVQPGFICDGASSPRIFWSLVGFLPRGIHDPAALIHDQLYEDKGLHNGQKYSRRVADGVFFKMMKECGVKNWHAAIAYIAVRLGGWYYWNR